MSLLGQWISKRSTYGSFRLVRLWSSDLLKFSGSRLFSRTLVADEDVLALDARRPQALAVLDLVAVESGGIEMPVAHLERVLTASTQCLPFKVMVPRPIWGIWAP